ncbi:hypothetical protein KHS38_09140 [Mucilaginibacter sp. Bleaf8]|uniref:hypothetical protein n=1 Tax=Mucilaginibacter sp. Bleaf8 TaxID=2834430 RepID=UPI001BCD4DD1|nr:hypothetical protein [Mucilaginibacter sp. Bleaf8]MBS7564569.1 hypothetical protein [Mucilaginibacter sp. Bleaf8]
MKRFLLRFFIFSIPVLVYILAGEWLLYKYRENVPISTVISKQLASKKEMYFFRSFLNTPEPAFKMKMMEVKKPDIITLGISVVLQYRDFYFHPYEKSFYNGGYLLKNVYDLDSYTDLMRKHEVHRPKLIVFGFDPSWIKKDYRNDFNNNILNTEGDGVRNLNKHIGAIQDVLHQAVDGELDDAAFSKSSYGKAGMQGNGYRRDGSMHNWNQIKSYLKNRHYSDMYQFKENLKANTFIYNTPMEVDKHKLKLLLKNLEAIKQMGIELIVYCPPASDDFYNYAVTNKGFQRLFTTYLSIQNQLIKENYRVIPFCTPKQVGLTDDYMLDGIHPGEIMVAKLFYNYMAFNKVKFKDFPDWDPSYLKEIIDKKPLCPLAFTTE